MLAQNANDGEPERLEAKQLATKALEAALPIIERDVLRRVARQILTLHALDRGHICPGCHGKTVYDPSISALDPHAILRCVNGHEFPRRSNRGPFNDMDTSLRRLTRGEPLPDVPPKEG